LKLKNEDWRCGLICNFGSRYDHFFTFCEHVRFDYPLNDVAGRFIEFACELMDLLNSSIMTGAGRRFVLPVSPKFSSSPVFGGTECGLKRETPLDGIIAYLKSRCGGNIHELGVVDVTACSIGNNGSIVLLIFRAHRIAFRRITMIRIHEFLTTS
jgi:hypothetical protein